MPRAKPKITLPPMQIASKLVLDRERRNLASATPERIVRAGEDATIGADGVQRVNTDPIVRLYRRGALHRDEELNEVFYRAAEEYRRIWWASGLGRSVGGINTSGVFSPSTDRNPGMPAGERQAHFRGRYRQAREQIGFYFGRVVDSIVLEGEEPERVGYIVSYRKDEKQARAVAMDRLSEGLRILAHHFGFAK